MQQHPLLASAALCACAAILFTGLAPAASADDGIRHETAAGDSDGITKSVVSYDYPMLPGSLPHSAKCDRTKYMRWRLDDGPEDADDADAIIVIQPGTVEGGAAFDPLARNTLRQLKAQGKRAEVWGLDRRENCAEDTTGLDAAIAAKDYRIAIDYYYNGKEIDGQRFQGWSSQHEPALADMGMGQIVRDMQFVLTHEIPLAADRKKKVFVGGHSQGVFLAGHFAAWDFGGDPATSGGAVKDQVAGMFGLDGILGADYQFLGDTIVKDAWNLIGGQPYPLVVEGLRSGIIPRAIDGGALGQAVGLGEVGFPAIAEVAKIAGIAARFEPDAESELLTRIPQGLQNFPTGLVDELAGRAFITQDYLKFLTGQTDPTKLRATNMALLGTLLDDNSSPIVAIQASFGGVDPGGPVGVKSFPIPDVLRRIPLLGTLVDFGGGASTKIAPLAADGQTVYRWLDYNQVPEAGLYTVDGVRYTDPTLEIASATNFADSVGTSVDGVGFIDSYENLRHLIDLGFLAAGYRGGELAGFKNPHWQDTVPVLTILGGKSFGAFRGLPRFLDSKDTVIAPSASHLDTFSTAAVQNGGRPDVPATSLANFVLQHSGDAPAKPPTTILDSLETGSGGR
ncbi:hypothetical protein [Nocardia sp. NBC_01327]|uniref:hypothetical protein n=1 Tax=Nocardia sp. NBC_01327 TaxID=2903593 RepID=UPI002E10A057|nr:hypothetical protein OG326_29840 [Nocardia sp. NBC_01327]